MTQALAILLYERLFPGSQLVNRLSDLNYRVHNLSNPADLPSAAEALSPLFILADLEPTPNLVIQAVTQLRASPQTNHIPVVGYCKETTPNFDLAAQHKEFTLLVSDAAVLAHLPQILEQALEVK